jgi:hypothetical protein
VPTMWNEPSYENNTAICDKRASPESNSPTNTTRTSRAKKVSQTQRGALVARVLSLVLAVNRGLCTALGLEALADLGLLAVGGSAAVGDLTVVAAPAVSYWCGVVGVLVTVVLAGLFFRVVRAKRRRGPSPVGPSAHVVPAPSPSKGGGGQYGGSPGGVNPRAPPPTAPNLPGQIDGTDAACDDPSCLHATKKRTSKQPPDPARLRAADQFVDEWIARLESPSKSHHFVAEPVALRSPSTPGLVGVPVAPRTAIPEACPDKAPEAAPLQDPANAVPAILADFPPLGVDPTVGEFQRLIEAIAGTDSSGDPPSPALTDPAPTLAPEPGTEPDRVPTYDLTYLRNELAKLFPQEAAYADPPLSEVAAKGRELLQMELSHGLEPSPSWTARDERRRDPWLRRRFRSWLGARSPSLGMGRGGVSWPATEEM